MDICTVTKEDIKTSLRQLGLQAGDICIVHSSLKSFGHVEGGAQTVIDAFEEVLGKEGTLAMPTLCQVDFLNSYKTWYMDKPSDVGYLTEYFRKQMYVYRSDEATHSVAARGKMAYELTKEHCGYGPHPLCLFGEYAMAESSPWAKLYRMNGKIVFIGVSMRKNTMKHTVEVRLVEHYSDMVKDPVKAQELKDQLYQFGKPGIWPGFDAEEMVPVLREKGQLQETTCGNAKLLCVNAKECCDTYFEEFITRPEKWFKEDFLAWRQACLDNA